MASDEPLIAAGAWCAPSETLYALGGDGEGPIVPDRLMRDRAQRPPHDCLLPPNPGAFAEGHQFCCNLCARWWETESDHCGECGRSGPVEWVRSYHPNEGPPMADGSAYARVPTIDMMITMPTVTALRGGVRYDNH